MGHFVVDYDEVEKYRQIVSDLEEELADWEDDYAILYDQEHVIAQMYTVSENSVYLTKCLDTSIDQIEELSRNDELTGFNQLFNFEELRSGGAYMNSFKTVNESYQDELKTVGTALDGLKTEVAAKIKSLNDDILLNERIIGTLLNNPSLWVEDGE